MPHSQLKLPSRAAAGLRVLLGILSLAAFAACGDSGTRPPDKTPQTRAIPISQARTQDNGATVTVEGYVTVPPGNFSSAMGDEGFAIQDDTGGIYVKVAEKLDFGLGARVRVTGKLNEVTSLRILESETASVEKLEGTRQVEPKGMSTGEVREPNEGLLVRVSGNVVEAFKDDSPYGYSLFLDDGSGWVQLYVHVSAGFDPETLRALTLGQRIQVTGFASQYETTYEVAPRQPSDLVVQ